MKLYLIERKDESWDYDQYDGFIVAAANKADATVVMPKKTTWPLEPVDVKVTYIGTAKPGTKRGMILGSFHAG